MMTSDISQTAEHWKAKLDNALHEKNVLTDQLEKVETKTGIKRLNLTIGVIFVLGLYLMIYYGTQLVCNVVGFLYPAYASIKAIERINKEDDTKWLIYWVVYAAFSLVELFTDRILFWVPFYWLLKFLFLCFCMAPTSWNGSNIIYSRIIRPLVLKYETKIDRTLDRANDVVTGIIGAGKDIAGDVAEKLARDVATQNLRQD